MIYALIGYLILNQLSHMFIIHVATVANDEELIKESNSFRGRFFHSIIGFPLVAVAVLAALFSGGKE